MINQRFFYGAACVAVLLSGCEKKPEGQVAAVVNGDEITLQEINSEMGAAQIPEGVDKKEVQQAALQRIIERRLLAQAAREDGLDKTPEYLIRSRQMDDALLVQLLGKKAERTLEVPEQRDIDKYIADNPSMFEGRQIFTIDRIQFPVPSDIDQLKSLENDHSMDAVAARLDTLGIDYQRGPAQMDSAQLGQKRLDQIMALPEGEPFVIPENGVITVGLITGAQAVSADGADLTPVAMKAMRNKKLGDALQERLKQAKITGEITYQPGFEKAKVDKTKENEAKDSEAKDSEEAKAEDSAV